MFDDSGTDDTSSGCMLLTTRKKRMNFGRTTTIRTATSPMASRSGDREERRVEKVKVSAAASASQRELNLTAREDEALEEDQLAGPITTRFTSLCFLSKSWTSDVLWRCYVRCVPVYDNCATVLNNRGIVVTVNSCFFRASLFLVDS